MQRRDFDIVVFGATGFAGALIAEYLAAHDYGLRWAIAGRSQQKLTELVDHLVERGLAHLPLETIIADSSDEASLRRMAKRTSVVATTVGPYIRFGEPLVRACVEEGTHYCDLTGEPEFVDRIRYSYDSAAREAGVRIVPCCGFDSIPHDLGAFFTVQHLPNNEPIAMRGFVRARGGVSGGTWHSFVEASARLRTYTKWKSQHRLPRVDSARKASIEPRRVRHDKIVGAWGIPLPTIDPHVVCRSARQIDAYGPNFTYGHYVRAPNASAAFGATTLGAVGVATTAALAQFAPTRTALLKIRAPGSGPSDEVRANGWFEVEFVGRAEGGAVARARVVGGEPGYHDTARMLSESAAALALDDPALPKRAGVLTPAAAFENVLIDRLTAQGMVFERLDSQGNIKFA